MAIDINNLVGDIMKNYEKSKYDLIFDSKINIQGKNLIRRSVSNIIENGLSYGSKIFIELKKICK